MNRTAPVHPRRAGASALLALSMAALAGCAPEVESIGSPSPSASAPAASPGEPERAAAVFPSGDPQPVATGLTTPWSVAFRGDTAFVSQRDTGEILEIVGTETRVVGEVDDVRVGGEGGLLGIATDDTHLYAYATTSDGNRVVRFPLEGAPGTYSLGAEETVVAGIPSARTHNGGRLAFGPDGMLYVTTGDAAERENSQDADSLGGKILRVTAEGDVPADNPFPGSPVWTLGHRNPQGIGWDAEGVMWASEFGQNTWDELNVIEPGANYGWPDVEGIGGDDRYTDPVAQWAPADASPSGLAVVEGSVLIANLRGERLRAVSTADPGAAREFFAGEYGRLRDAVLAPDGALWLVTSDTDRGGGDSDRILRVELAAS
ncbi:PQQ-dependent sugar dehydrogenase [Microbacterium testaceum]|uniref:PQQ-dependent sugar dehydrogenase n=1 Tax=Microbacterium testaceum TaxID=2033 RepID=UPI0012445AE1|nr:PQQ-dependent sugar dehydrogenase [Microbacterium testaceum]